MRGSTAQRTLEGRWGASDEKSPILVSVNDPLAYSAESLSSIGNGTSAYTTKHSTQRGVIVSTAKPHPAPAGMALPSTGVTGTPCEDMMPTRCSR